MSDDIKLVIAIPTAGTVKMGFAYSLAGLIGYLSANAIPSRPESTIEVKMDVVESSVIHTNREKLVRRAIDSGMTHLMFLDDDMVFEPNILDIMLGRRQPVVCTNYLIKTDACDSFVAVGLNDKRVATTEKSTGLKPIAYSGFGVSVFEVDVFKNTPQPWFLPKFIPEDNGYTTEDNPFYERVRAAGYKVYLDQDASKLISHLGGSSWNWREYKNG
jgi:ABC-type Fe3+-hydroxamate transport system substrate-binding protein